MRYSGTIFIVDDEGNSVFERELSEDEIVEAILAAVPGDEAVETATEDVNTPPLTKGEKRIRACGMCGKPGHTARTCGRLNEESDADWEAKRAAKQRKKIEEGVAKLVREGLSFDEIATAYPDIEQRELEELIAYAERSLED